MTEMQQVLSEMLKKPSWRETTIRMVRTIWSTPGTLTAQAARRLRRELNFARRFDLRRLAAMHRRQRHA